MASTLFYYTFQFIFPFLFIPLHLNNKIITTMTIDDNKVVSISYQLYCGEGDDIELMEEATAEEPETFKVGNGEMLDKFEEQLIGLKKGDSFDIYVEPQDAYGEWSEDNVKTFPKTTFLCDGEIDEEELYEGNAIMMLNEDDEECPALVTSVTKDEVTLDFNHPLADERLHFVGKVIDVKW